MKNQPEPGPETFNSVEEITHRADFRELHSLQDLPISVGEVSSGPLGSISRKDHITWQTKSVTDPAYWYGRLDSALRERIRDCPLPSVAICFATGILLGVAMGGSGNLRSRS